MAFGLRGGVLSRCTGFSDRDGLSPRDCKAAHADDRGDVDRPPSAADGDELTTGERPVWSCCCRLVSVAIGGGVEYCLPLLADDGVDIEAGTRAGEGNKGETSIIGGTAAAVADCEEIGGRFDERCDSYGDDDLFL